MSWVNNEDHHDQSAGAAELTQPRLATGRCSRHDVQEKPGGVRVHCEVRLCNCVVAVTVLLVLATVLYGYHHYYLHCFYQHTFSFSCYFVYSLFGCIGFGLRITPSPARKALRLWYVLYTRCILLFYYNYYIYYTIPATIYMSTTIL